MQNLYSGPKELVEKMKSLGMAHPGVTPCKLNPFNDWEGEKLGRACMIARSTLINSPQAVIHPYIVIHLFYYPLINSWTIQTDFQLHTEMYTLKFLETYRCKRNGACAVNL